MLVTDYGTVFGALLMLLAAHLFYTFSNRHFLVPGRVPWRDMK